MTAVSTYKFSLVFRKLDATTPIRRPIAATRYYLLDFKRTWEEIYSLFAFERELNSFTSGRQMGGRDRRRTEPRPQEYSLHTSFSVSVFNLLWRETGRRAVPFYVCKNHKSLIKEKKTLYYELTEYLIKVSQTVKNVFYFFRSFVHRTAYLCIVLK